MTVDFHLQLSTFANFACHEERMEGDAKPESIKPVQKTSTGLIWPAVTHLTWHSRYKI